MHRLTRNFIKLTAAVSGMSMEVTINQKQCAGHRSAITIIIILNKSLMKLVARRTYNYLKIPSCIDMQGAK